MNTLRGMDRPMTTVGRRVLKNPRTTVGRMVSMKAKTTDTANRNPNVPSRTRLSIWPWISGPWSVTTMTSTSSGMPSRLARTSLTAVVTSTVLASGSLDTLTERPGLPLVREMLEVRPAPNVTSATSESRTEPVSFTPTTRFRRSSNRFQGVGGLCDHRLCPIEKQARWEGHVVVAKGGGDLKEGYAVGRHLLKVRRDDEVAVNVPDQLDLRDPLNVLDLRDDQVLHQRLDLDEWPVRHHAELDHRKGVRVETAHGGVIHGGREVHAIEGILNKRFGCGHIRAVLECGKDCTVLPSEDVD